MEIGITIGITKENESIWINGIKMNAIFLSKALQKAGHKVTILDTNPTLPKITNDIIDYDLNEFPTEKFSDYDSNIELLILLGTSFLTPILVEWKARDPRRRIIKYQCGNNYVIDMERSLFPKDQTDPKNCGITEYQRGCLDEIWYVPQQGYQNKSYYAAMYDLPLEKVIPVPFIWDPMFLDRDIDIHIAKLENKEINIAQNGFPVYRPGRPEELRKFFIMEPNSNVVKFAHIPLLIIELFKRAGNKIGMAHIMSGDRLIHNSYWQSMISKLDLLKPGDTNIRTHGRLPVIPALAAYADFVVSHQWHNPLNYAYLDTLYLRYPLIHNAEMIQDAGYYYEGFNAHDGLAKLEYAIANHDNETETYNERSEEVLNRYTINNDDMIELYTKLISDLKSKKRDGSLSYEYDWKTNLYK